MERFWCLEEKEREIQYRRLRAIFVTLNTELEGLIYRPKKGRKGGKNGRERIQVSPKKCSPPDTNSGGKQNTLL